MNEQLPCVHLTPCFPYFHQFDRRPFLRALCLRFGNPPLIGSRLGGVLQQQSIIILPSSSGIAALIDPAPSLHLQDSQC